MGPRPGWDFLDRMPKADLHVHIDGAVRTATILELAKAQGMALPAKDAESLAPFVTVGPDSRSLADFLRTFEVFYPLLRNADAVERIAYELVLDEANDGVVYVEARFAPALQASGGFTIDDAVHAALRGLEAGAAETGIDTGLILCCYRSEPPAASEATVDAALRFREEGVVGVDLAGDELNFPAAPHAEFLLRAKKAGLPLTIHAGEVGTAKNLREAVFLFGASRLGHAVRLPEDPELMEHVADEDLPVEVCLSSNLKTGAVHSIEAHPLRSFLDAGVPVVLNTDDPAVCRTTLSKEYALAVETFSLTVEELRRMAAASIASAFAPEGTRRRLSENFERWFDAQRG